MSTFQANAYQIPARPVHAPHPELLAELEKIRSAKSFDPAEYTSRKCASLLDYLKKHNLGCCVLSISGGIDSSCVLGLLVRAQEMAEADPSHPFRKANGGRIIAVSQPIESTPEIYQRAFEVAKSFNIDPICVDQTSEWRSLTAKVESEMKSELQGFSKSMFKSYMRTPVAFLLASSYRGVVIGTGNLDEDGYLYYYCKFGDGAVDVGLIHDIHKSEVFKVGAYIGVPQSVLSAPPSADLAPNQTDEAEIGATYDMVELVYNYIVNYSAEQKKDFLDSLSPEARQQFDSESSIIQSIHERGRHKADLNPKNI